MPKKKAQTPADELSKMSLAEREALLKWHEKVKPQSPLANVDVLVDSTRFTTRYWYDNAALITLMENKLKQLTDHPKCQFIQRMPFYKLYRDWQTELDPYAKYASSTDLLIWMRKWFWIHHRDWEEKSQHRYSSVHLSSEFGAIQSTLSGFGKIKLTYDPRNLLELFGVGCRTALHWQTCWTGPNDDKFFTDQTIATSIS
jgi:hypothetical protein